MSHSTASPTNVHSQQLELWLHNLIASHDALHLDPDVPIEHFSLYDSLVGLRACLHCRDVLHHQEVVATILRLAQQYQKRYRYWFVFDKHKSFLLLMLYPYHT